MIQKNVKCLMLGTADLTLMTAGTVISSAADMTEGQLAIVNSTNTTVTTDQTGTAPYLVRVVQRVGDELVYSPFIDCSKLRGVRAQSGVNPSEQVSFVGYNGSSGALEDAASSDYIIKAIMKNVKTVYNNTPDINHWAYKSAASTTEAAVAKGLLDSFNSWAKRNPEDILKCERTVAVSSTDEISDGGGSGVIFKVTKGLKSVLAYTKTVAASAAVTASTVTVTDGDIINFPSTNAKSFTFDALDTDHVIYIGGTSYVVADAGTAADGSDNQDAIVTAINAGTQATAVASSTATVTITYKPHIYGTLPPMVISDADGTPANVAVTIASGDSVPVHYKVDGTTAAAASFTLDAPWQGETGYLYEGETSTTIGTTVASGDTWGLKFTGKALPVDAEKWNYQKVKFTLGLDGDFASTVPITYSVDANPGVGNYGQIAIAERQLQMNEGQAWVNAYPSVNHRAEAAKISKENYPLYLTIVEFYDDNFVPVLGDTPKSYGTVVIATPNSTGHGLIGDVFGI